MEDLLNELYAIKDSGVELDEYQRGVFDTLSWQLEGTNKPEIND
jgi:hypothetical protein